MENVKSRSLPSFGGTVFYLENSVGKLPEPVHHLRFVLRERMGVAARRERGAPPRFSDDDVKRRLFVRFII